ncbi:MAG TPA: recombination mediator RecR [Phycisphaerae bacterium]|jgi:recombination protein RecR|nr:recombination mediator RecR [Phycisphaerae bacterium]
MPNNAHYTDSLRKLMELFGRLPGVGSRSAERMAFHLLKSSREDALALADAIRAVKDQVKHCSICFNLTETDPCSICADPDRDHGVICVVEQPKDLLQLEATGIYKGVYHVLLGRIAPLEHVTPADLTIPQLLDRLKPAADGTPSPVREIILATNPTMEGDGTALYIQQELGYAAPNVAVTRLARGLPAGAQIEYSNKAILADAINGRTKV